MHTTEAIMHNSIYIEGISFSDLRKQLFQELKKTS